MVGSIHGGTMTDWQAWFQQAVEEGGDSPAASHYDSLRSFRVRQRMILDWIGDVHGKTILDVGPGAGHFSQPLTRHNQVIGLDFVPTMLHYAANKGMLPVQANGMQLPFESESMDIVICVGVLQHIDDTESFIKELLRVRKPDGQVYLETLNRDSLVRKLYYLLPWNHEFMHTYQMGELMGQFRRLAPQADVNVAEIYYPLPSYRRVGRNPGVSRYLSTAFAIRIG
jgi:ubiquinone/menaquinone biosynthesis C-methylase UbiE